MRFEGKRGDIFDRQGRSLATDIINYSVFADPLLIKRPSIESKTLALHLDLSYKDLFSKLQRKKRFVWVRRKIPWEDKEEIRDLKIPGVGFIPEEKRFYPQGNLGASFLGVVDIDNKGIEALEVFYNNYLSGKDGWVRVLQDSVSHQIMLSTHLITPQKGADLVLTIDAQLQYWTEFYLEKTIKEFKAKEGSVVIMNASNGEILALANYPFFNPNDLSLASLENMRNRAITDIFEPGSVFKIVTLIAAIGENKLSDEDIFFCENGKMRVPGTTLHDWKPYGDLTFREVFMKSSNIGVSKIVESLGAEVFYRYIKLLGFGDKTGIDLPGEVKGILRSFKSWSRTSPYIIPMGQEVGVNLLQLARAIAIIANGGYLVRPHIVKEICSGDICKPDPIRTKKILSAAITERAKGILIDVVSAGTGKRANISGRKIGGKTGTAQKYDLSLGRYSPTKHRASFIGFIADLGFPLVIAISIDEPRRSHFGGVVAAPLFRKIAKKTIDYIETSNSLIDERSLELR